MSKFGGKKVDKVPAALGATMAPIVKVETPQPPKGDGTLYTYGPKPYKPKVDHNKKTWAELVLMLNKKPQTLDELAKVCVYGDVTHKDFVGYMVRGKHIAPVV